MESMLAFTARVLDLIGICHTTTLATLSEISYILSMSRMWFCLDLYRLTPNMPCSRCNGCRLIRTRGLTPRERFIALHTQRYRRPLVIPPEFAVVFEAYLYCRFPAAVRFVQLSVLVGRLRRVKRHLFDLLHLGVNTGDTLTQKVLRNG
jgi:hypothetical protein